MKTVKPSMLEKIVTGVVAGACVLTLNACDPGTGNGKVNVSGGAADGPFQINSQVLINKLDNSMGGTAETVYSTTDAIGRFQATLANNSCYLTTVTGKDFNEISGIGSESDISLSALYCTGTSGEAEFNNNDVTQMTLERIKALYLTDMTFADASAQARDELFAELGFVIAPDCLPHEMDVITGPNSCNDPLLAVELVVRNYAVNQAPISGNTIEYELHDMLSSIMFDFADGTIEQEKKDLLNASAMTLDVASVTVNLQTYLENNSADGLAPDANNALDQDFDGQVNALDCAPFDATIWTGHADVDGDGHDSVLCGGDDCDDTDETSYGGAAPSCFEAIDHDCTGVIDALEGCGACTVGELQVISGPITDRGSIRSLYLLGDNAFFTTTYNPGSGPEARLEVLNISNPLNLEEINSITDDTFDAQITMRDTNLYVFGGSQTFAVRSAADPSNLEVLSALAEVGNIMNTAASDAFISSAGKFIYLAGDRGLSILNVEDSANPLFVEMPIGPQGTIDSDVNITSLFGNNSDVFFTDVTGLYPAQQSEEGPLQIYASLALGESNDVRIKDNYALVATADGIAVIDVADKQAPSLLETFAQGSDWRRMVLAGNQLFAISKEALAVFDASALPNLEAITSLDLGVSDNDLKYNYDLFVTADKAYAIKDGDLYIFDLGCAKK